MSAPYIPLYIDDFDAATAHLNPEEEGVYMRLLKLAWRTPGCSLPNEPEWIARKIRVDMAAFERVVSPVLKEFFTPYKGRLIQRRLKREYDVVTRKRIARQKAGRIGGICNALKNQDKDASNATVLPRDTRAVPEPEPEPEDKKERKPPSPLPGGVNEKFSAQGRASFEAFWGAYPKKVAKRTAAAAYLRAMKRATSGEILAGVERAGRLSKAWRQGYVPNPATWLNGDGWLDVHAAVKPVLVDWC